MVGMESSLISTNQFSWSRTWWGRIIAHFTEQTQFVSSMVGMESLLISTNQFSWSRTWWGRIIAHFTEQTQFVSSMVGMESLLISLNQLSWCRAQHCSFQCSNCAYVSSKTDIRSFKQKQSYLIIIDFSR